MLTSAARETLRGVETLILDEVHAVAGTKRGAHLALSVERLAAARRRADPADRALGDPAAARGDRAVRLGRPPDRAGRRRHPQGARPAGRRPGRGSPRARLDRRSSHPLLSEGEVSDGSRARDPSIWPSMYPELLKLVEAHRSTIVFVNNRRLAERLALRLNELAEREIARAHHGSLAREQRVLVEEDLKAGRIPCLVATSSLELGIDMGAVDLVIQVESPKSVARGLQRDRPGRPRAARGLEGADLPEVPRRPARVGGRRAGDARTARSRRRRSRATRSTCSHSRSSRSWPTRRSRSPSSTISCGAPIRSPTSRAPSSRTSSTCSPGATRPTSSPSCGRGSSGTAPVATIRAREGARRLAVTNAGTIPDRGLFGVFLVDGGGRVGELDEEMVYEARAGQTFLLGASTWRIEEITRDRVLVSPAPGAAGRGAVLERRGRRAALRARREDRRRFARAVGARRRRRRSTRLRDDYLLDERAARNLLAFLRDQADATGAVPSDRTIVDRALPRRDRRLARLHPDAVRRPRARAVGDGDHRPAARVARPRRAVDLVGRRHRDPLPRRRRRRPRSSELLVDPAEVEDLVVAELGETALFGARFRENAARALLIPRRRPGPAHAALAAAAQGAVAAAGGAHATARSRSCSRPTASACRTCSTCPRCGPARRDPDARARPRRGRDR